MTHCAASAFAALEFFQCSAPAACISMCGIQQQRTARCIAYRKPTLLAAVCTGAVQRGYTSIHGAIPRRDARHLCRQVSPLKKFSGFVSNLRTRKSLPACKQNEGARGACNGETMESARFRGGIRGGERALSGGQAHGRMRNALRNLLAVPVARCNRCCPLLGLLLTGI